jgi:hypothetical protein
MAFMGASKLFHATAAPAATPADVNNSLRFKAGLLSMLRSYGIFSQSRWQCKRPDTEADRLHFVSATNLLLGLFLCSGVAFAQSVDKDPVATVELGGAAGWSLKNGGSSFGADAAVEVTPIENWLELEAGVTPLFSRHHSTEWNADLLFKKPWTLSRKAELMAGVGPEWVHTREPGMRANSIAAEAVVDLMFWPGGKHKFGWFLEPGYDYNFARGHERSFGIACGLLIAIP